CNNETAACRCSAKTLLCTTSRLERRQQWSQPIRRDQLRRNCLRPRAPFLRSVWTRRIPLARQRSGERCARQVFSLKRRRDYTQTQLRLAKRITLGDSCPNGLPS